MFAEANLAALAAKRIAGEAWMVVTLLNYSKLPK